MVTAAVVVVEPAVAASCELEHVLLHATAASALATPPPHVRAPAGLATSGGSLRAGGAPAAMLRYEVPAGDGAVLREPGVLLVVTVLVPTLPASLPLSLLRGRRGRGESLLQLAVIIATRCCKRPFTNLLTAQPLLLLQLLGEAGGGALGRVVACVRAGGVALLPAMMTTAGHNYNSDVLLERNTVAHTWGMTGAAGTSIRHEMWSWFRARAQNA